MRLIKIFSNNILINPVYHGSDHYFNKFDVRRSAQGVFWFSEDKEDILSGKAGIGIPKYLYTVNLNVRNPAGWDEYQKLFLQQIKNMGFDSIKLDNNWVVFDSDNIKIIKKEKVL